MIKRSFGAQTLQGRINIHEEKINLSKLLAFDPSINGDLEFDSEVKLECHLNVNPFTLKLKLVPEMRFLGSLQYNNARIKLVS